jgi:serine/threonine protein kinase/sugar lactone lactonase YvrE
MSSSDPHNDASPQADDRAQRYRAVTALFDAVRDLPREEAHAHVAAHPSKEVRDDVLAMLDADRAGTRAVRTIVDVSTVIAEASAAPEIPAMVGDYRVSGLLGHGGGGVVLKAVCPKTAADVAIKVLGIGAWSSRALGRFRQEIKLLGHLTHPGIAQILDAGTDRSGVSPHPYFVMEFVDGMTLSEWRRATPRTPREIVELFAAIVDAVAFSHARGIIHRDLKPSNILVTTDGRPKILDFGVASVAQGADPSLDPLRTLTMMLQFAGTRHGNATRGATKTAEGAVVGTLPYMSPEQISGTQVVDARSDLYSIGVMLYEALCGKLPYDLSLRSLTDAAMVIRNEIPTTIGRVDRGLRGDLEVIVSRLLEKRPADRYESAPQLLDDLERFLRGQRTRVRRIPLHIRMLRFARRYPAYIASSALLAAVALGSLGYAGYLVAAERLAERARAADELDAMRLKLSSAAFAVGRGLLEQSRSELAEVPASRRNWAWHALDRFHGRGELVSFIFYAALDIQSRGERIFFREGEAGAWPAVFDLRDGTRRALDVPLPSSPPIAVSPDGSRMARAHAPDGGLFVRSTADGSVLDVLESPIEKIDAIAWSDDGAMLLLANRAGELAAIDLVTGRALRTRFDAGAAASERVFLRTVGGAAVVGLEGAESIFVWSFAADGRGAEPRVIPLVGVGAGVGTGVGVSSLEAVRVEGVQRAFVGTTQGAVLDIDLAQGTIARRYEYATSPIEALAVEPTRGLLAAATGERADKRRGSLQVWDVSTGEAVGTLGLGTVAFSIAFSQDGESLFVGETFGELTRYAVVREVLSPTVGSAEMPVNEMAFAGGGLMAVTTAEGAFWWNWDLDRQASRARPERIPIARELVAGRPIAVIAVAASGPNADTRAVLAVVAPDATSVVFYATSGEELGRMAITGRAPADAEPSISATAGGFVLGVGRRVERHAVIEAGGRVRTELIGSDLLDGIVEGVSATPDGTRVVAAISGAEADRFGAWLVGLDAGARGAPRESWRHPISEESDARELGAAISNDGGTAFAVPGKGQLGVFDGRSGANIFAIDDVPPWSIDRRAVGLAMSPDGRALAVRFADGSVRIVESAAFDAEAGEAR